MFFLVKRDCLLIFAYCRLAWQAELLDLNIFSRHPEGNHGFIQRVLKGLSLRTLRFDI